MGIPEVRGFTGPQCCADAAGAMENWGLITYRETDLLVREDEDSAPSIHKVAMVVAHEIAHQAGDPLW